MNYFIKNTTGIRKITRKLKLNTFIFNLFYNKLKYESNFDDFFNKKLKKNYIVFDIGANIGYYSKIFSELVMPQGQVHAFEPSKLNFDKLNSNLRNSNIKTYNIAIGNMNKKLFLNQGTDDIGATSKLNESNNGVGNWVDVTTIDELINSLPIPNAIKIDVEGFEINVLEGARRTLLNPELKVVGVEIHSTILDEQGVKNPVNKIEKIFNDSGFILKWTDFSHVVAYRLQETNE